MTRPRYGLALRFFFESSIQLIPYFQSDFEAAARLGSEFAKTQLVVMNPYAAMCNKMLSDVMGRLRRGEPEDQQSDSHEAA